ncbi:carbon catabolite repressor protein 4 homolog 1-like [Olea europaea var. sylvestris]|uniref:carbon catabolite repressor protein 4 homolog 1-like n=1 Tax=Olea europaea var. sylvestris TaxID=158386 RepID=UPI000C1D2C5A|nr:carbon catabolite repressor protein 4 homolog 1-like [Olea europaea var. sylvestris]
MRLSNLNKRFSWGFKKVFHALNQQALPLNILFYVPGMCIWFLYFHNYAFGLLYVPLFLSAMFHNYAFGLLSVPVFKYNIMRLIISGIYWKWIIAISFLSVTLHSANYVFSFKENSATKCLECCSSICLIRYRVQSDKKVAVCSVHPSEQATLQCIGCVKAKIPVSKSYHCSSKCFSDAWQHHRLLHERAASAVNENGNEEEEVFARINGQGNTGAAVVNTSLSASQSSSSLGNSTTLYPAAIQSGSETMFEVGRSKTYTPTADDIGHVLKFECVVVDAETKSAVAHSSTIMTSRVIPAPSPSYRRLIPVSGIDAPAHLDMDGRISSVGTFTVLSYNILSEVYATIELYSYCPPWALSWAYRRQNLLREIVGYRADIVCLQEVQSDHFDEFFAPELDKHGYQALFKKKTAEVYSGDINSIDGCATFFRRDKFSHVKKYEVEFNKAAQSLTDAVVPSAQKNTALNRLVKDNVALIVVLEAKFSNLGVDNPGKRQLVCVANTHVNMHQDLKDVKLWQVHTLLKGLEKIAASADIPMLVCGDFNSVPGSAPHSLLAMGKVDPLHPDLAQFAKSNLRRCRWCSGGVEGVAGRRI